MLTLLITAALAVELDLPAYMVEGEPAEISVTGAPARRAVYLLVGTEGRGDGPCPAILGGQCVDILNPTVIRRTASAAGEVVMTVSLPEAAVGVEYCVQAVVIEGGVASLSDAQCTVGAVSGAELTYGSHAYLITGEAGSIASAVAMCADRGMHVVTLDGDDERNWLDGELVARGDLRDVWLGAFDEAAEGTWLDAYGQPLTYTSWLGGEPNNLGDEDCAALRTSLSVYGLGMNDALCSETDFQIVCEADGLPSLYGNHIYTMVNQSMTWWDAVAYCDVRGDSLVLIEDASESAWIEDWLNASAMSTWIGLTDIATEGTWLDVDGAAATYFDWRAGEPNNDGGEHCVHIEFGYPGWNDVFCEASITLICESGGR